MRVTGPESLPRTEDEEEDDRVDHLDEIDTQTSEERGAAIETSEPTAAKSGKGPLRLIHVIFGLCLDILAKTSSAGSSGATVNNQSSANLSNLVATDAALQGSLAALHSILDPAFIRADFLQDVFLEMMTILERVAWMEGSRVQGLVVGVISKVIQGYGEHLFFQKVAKKSTSEIAQSPLQTVMPESRLQSIVQLLVELYMQKSTGTGIKFGKNSSARAGQKAAIETIELMGRVTEMLTVLVKTAPAEYQLHLAAVTLNVLVGKPYSFEFIVHLQVQCLIPLTYFLSLQAYSVTQVFKRSLDPTFS